MIVHHFCTDAGVCNKKSPEGSPKYCCGSTSVRQAKLCAAVTAMSTNVVTQSTAVTAISATTVLVANSNKGVTAPISASGLVVPVAGVVIALLVVFAMGVALSMMAMKMFSMKKKSRADMDSEVTHVMSSSQFGLGNELDTSSRENGTNVEAQDKNLLDSSNYSLMGST